jgi:DNA-binding MarR family transcriptional regulator
MPKLKNRAVKGKGSRNMKIDSAKIEGQSFWRCVTFADTVKRYCEITMKKDEVSPLHSIAMFYLAYCGGVTTPTRLADVMFRSKHSVTKIVDNLEREGFIVRDFSSKDRRVTRLKVTEAGRQYVQDNLNMADQRAKHVMDCLNAEEQKTLIALTGKMCDRMIDLLEKLD